MLTPLQVRTETEIDGVAVLKQCSDAPMITGSDPQGATYICGSCSAVLAKNVEAGTLWDIGLRCKRCQTVSITPSLPAGQPLPQETVVIDAGEYLLTSTIEQQPDVVLAGRVALDRRTAETGRPPAGTAGSMDAPFLDDLARRGQELIGDDFSKLDAAYRRGLQRSTTPPTRSHRFIELIAIAREDAASYDRAAPGVHLLDIVELHAALEQLERWKNDPSMPALLKSLRGADDYAHALVTLTAASFLTDAGNAVELARPAGHRRTPDLRLHIGSQRRVNVEVKVPQALVRPASAIDLARATDLIRAAVSSAGTGERGQLSPQHPGLLIVGGLGLRSTDVDCLEAAGRFVLTERPDERAHITGISLVTVGSLLDGVAADRSDVRVGPQISAGATVAIRIALNPNYTGETTLNTDTQSPALRPIAGDVADITLDAIRAVQSGAGVGRNDPCWCGSGTKFKRCHGA